MASPREDVYKAFDRFGELYSSKYPKAWQCLQKDKESLLAFYDFPAEHWKHLRTTNPIESTFAALGLRHRRTKGSGSRKTSLVMMSKLAESASKRWRRLDGQPHYVSLLESKKFVSGILQAAA